MENERGDSIRLLLVEDEAVIGMAEASALRAEGYSVVHELSGEGAIAAMEASPRGTFDLVLMDIDLGSGMDGTAAAEAILRGHDVPVVFLSSYSEKAVVEKTEEITNYGYVVKNLGNTILFAAVKMALKLHRAHKRIEENEERFRELVVAISEGLCTMDERDDFVFANPAAHAIFGVPMGSLVGMNLASFLDQEGAAAIRRQQGQRKKGFKGEYEHEIVRPDGRRRRVHVRASPRFDRGRRFMGSFVVFQDVTAARRRDEALLESEERYRSLVENLDAGILVVDLEDRFIYANRTAHVIFGEEDGSIIGRRLGEFLDQENLAIVAAETEIRKAGLKSEYEFEIVRADGARRRVSTIATPRLGADRGVVGTLAIIRDVSEIHQARIALAESEAHYRSLFEDSPYLIAEEDYSALKARVDSLKAAGTSDLRAYFEAAPGELRACARLVRLIKANRQYLRAVGAYSVEEAARMFPGEVRESFLPGVLDEILALDAGKLPFEKEVADARDPSNVRFVKISVSLVQGHERDWSRVLVTMIDLTDEKLAKQGLARSLEEKDALMKELSHRVKNNLNLVSSLLSLEAGQTRDAACSQVLLEAQSRIQSISLIYDLLSGAAGLASLDARTYVEDLLRFLVDSYGDSTGKVRIETELGAFSIDVKRAVPLGLVVNELLTNALKYAFPGEGCGTIRVRIAEAGEEVVVEISDDGVGLPPGFDRASGGSLGFQIVDLLAGQLGGAFELASGKGVTARVAFPRKEPNGRH